MMRGSSANVPPTSGEEGLIEELQNFTETQPNEETLKDFSRRLRDTISHFDDLERREILTLYRGVCISMLFGEPPDWVQETSFALQGRVWTPGRQFRDI